MQKEKIDPITLTVLWKSVVSIAEEMGTALKRTAFSDAVREGEDFSTGLFDSKARLIAQGNYSPGHLGSMFYVLKHILKTFPEESMKPGDSIIVNDSYMGSGHYPDIFMITPVFMKKEIIGYAVNCTHHVDVGGAAPGSQIVDGVTEAFQEGLRILPVKLIENGEFNQDILRIILGNVRMPEKVKGDLYAQYNANYIGSKRLIELHETYGIDTFQTAVEEILNRSETRMRELISKIPDGEYTFGDFFDDSGPGTPPIQVNVKVTISGDEVTADFSESSDQVAAGFNSYINYTRAYTIFAMKVLTDPELPQNEGAVRPITTVARRGSFFNPIFPAPSSGRATVQARIFEVIAGALSKAIPGRVMAGVSHWSNPNIGGIDPETGESFVHYDLIMGGYGARAGHDGVEGLCPIFNAANIPVEVHESNGPVLIHQLELLPDSGGAGKFRGGCGVRKDIEILCDKAIITLLGDRHKHPAFGLFGGKSGKLAKTILNPSKEGISLTSKEEKELKKGDIISFRLAGGGGYGSPSERDVSRVIEDVLEGYISAEAAEKDYGVSASKIEQTSSNNIVL